LTHLALGIIVSLLFVSREAGIKFFRFNSGLAAALVAIAFFFRTTTDDTTFGVIAFRSLVVCEAAIVFYWAMIGRALTRIRPAILGLVCAAGLVTVIAQAIDTASGRAAAMQALTIASFLSS